MTIFEGERNGQAEPSLCALAPFDTEWQHEREE